MKETKTISPNNDKTRENLRKKVPLPGTDQISQKTKQKKKAKDSTVEEPLKPTEKDHTKKKKKNQRQKSSSEPIIPASMELFLYQDCHRPGDAVDHFRYLSKTYNIFPKIKAFLL